MPLMQSASKKAFKKNVETEMDANPGKAKRAQNLAIAYSVQKKNKPKKKMAEGGAVKDTAAGEDRPMPDNRYQDSGSIGRNSGNKALSNSQWTDNPTVKQAQKPSITPLSRPKIVGSDAFSVRNRDMTEDENDFQMSVPPQSPKAQPKAMDDEEGPNRQGPAISDMAEQHNNRKPPYKFAKEDQYSEDEAESDMKQMADGGRVDMEPKDHGMELDERDDEAHLQSSASPASPEEQPNKQYDESHEYGMKSGEPDEASPHTGETEQDMLRRHAKELAAFAKGGQVMNPKLEQSHEEPSEDDMPYDNISDHIMAKKKKKMMADGGEVDLDNNAREFGNAEDDMSWNALRKENYSEESALTDATSPEDSNEHGRTLSDADAHDMVDTIRKKLKSIGRI